MIVYWISSVISAHLLSVLPQAWRARPAALLAFRSEACRLLLQEAAERAQEDDEAGDQAGDLRGIDRQVDIAAAGRDMLDEERGENGAEGAQTTEEGNRRCR